MMNVLNGINGKKHLRVSASVILGIIVLAISWMTPGCVQQSPKNPPQNQAATLPSDVSTFSLQTPPLTAEHFSKQPVSLVELQNQLADIQKILLQKEAQQISHAVGQQPVPILDLEKQLLDFQKTLSQSAKEHQDFLQTQEQHHQQFLEWCYNFSVGFFSSCVVIIGIILTGLHFKTRADIKKAVDERIIADIDRQIARATSLTEGKIDAATQAANAAMDAFNKHLDNLKLRLESVDGPNIIKLASIMARASVILGNIPSETPTGQGAADQQRLEVIHLLKEIQKWAPIDRTIVIYIGRLYRQMGNCEKAIAELNEVIKKRIQRNENKDQNHSDILYNKACYLNLNARKNEGQTAEQFREQAWTTLTEAVQIWPANLEDAKSDEDLADLIGQNREWEKLEVCLQKK